MNGILVIDKPKDFTSFDVVAVVRKALHEKKTGHTGTLDPMATGVLPILLGSATKAQNLLPNSDKEYRADFKLGITTDTLDITGKRLSEKKACAAGGDINDILPLFRGNIMQKPPMYSAVSKNGVRLYELARKGIVVEREERPVTVHRLILDSFDEASQSGSLIISCSKGTYIRVICSDIGERLGCGCVMTGLRRTKACGFSDNDAISTDKLRELAEDGKIEEYIKPVDSVFSDYDSVFVTENQAFRFNNGGGLMLSRLRGIRSISDGSLYRVYDNNRVFLGLGAVNSERQELSVKKRF